MYSRYTPNPEGGFDRKIIPDPPALPRKTGGREETAETERQPASSVRQEPGAARQKAASQGRVRAGNRESETRNREPETRNRDPDHGMAASETAPCTHLISPPRPPPRPRPEAREPGRCRCDSPGLLAGFLPQGINTEELLILAVLILAMKQDGATTTELLIAAAVYLWF